jgi:hypothetical protein
MDEKAISEYRELKKSGVQVRPQNQIRPNPGSETAIHAFAKMAVARIGQTAGYNVDSETEVDCGGRIDVLLWGHPERMSYAVEIEHSPTEAVMQDKLETYVLTTAIDELVMINANELPQNVLEMEEQIRTELGL